MSKFKVGQRVITHGFSGDYALPFYPDMGEFIQREGEIKRYDKEDNSYLVHNFWWPEDALTLVEPKVEDKNDAQEFGWDDENVKEYIKGYFNGATSEFFNKSFKEFKEYKMRTENKVSDKEEVVYILQQDLPNIDKGEYFIKKGGDYYSSENKDAYGEYIFYKPALVENDTAWFKLKEIPKPYVVNIDTRENVYLCFIELHNGYLPKCHSVMKERLAEMIVADNEGRLQITK